MAIEHLRIFVILILFSQVLTSYAPYFHYAGPPYPIPPYVTSYPVQSYAPSPAPIYAQPIPQPANYQPASNLQPYKTPGKPVASPASYPQAGTSIAAHAPTPNTIAPPIYQPSTYQAPPHQQPIKATPVAIPAPDPPKLQPIKPTPCIPTEALPSNPLPKDISGSTFDSNVLNNLAIALQLLIVSNLIYNPPPDPNPAPQVIDDDIIPAIAPLPIAYVPPSIPELPSYSNQYIPNSNFLGTTSFGDTGISKSMMNAYGSPTIPAPRPARLMSPYDAIGPNSPFVDFIQPKPEPKSPYHLTSDYKDLFSLSELFKI